VYLACSTEVDAFDLATNRVVARYTGLSQNNICPMACVGPLPNVVVLDNAGGLWTSALISWKWVTERFDLASGRVTAKLDGYWLMGSGNGVLYVWGGLLAHASMSTGAILGADSIGDSFPSPGPAPDDRTGEWSGYTQVACGKLLASRDHDGQTDLSYASWPGVVHEPGALVQIEEFGGACWGLFSDGSEGYGSPYHMARLGPSGVDRRSPVMPDPMRGFNGALWLERRVESGKRPVYQRLDTTTWTLIGVPWTVPDTCYEALGSGGAVWCSDGATVSRLDIPMSGIPPSPSQSPSSSPSAAPSGSGSPAPSISPSDLPTASAEP
jgi:hypothetical protein